MKGITTGLVWDDANADALDHAVFDTPKVSKPILEKMCALTRVQYTSPEKDIDLIQRIVNLIDLGVAVYGHLRGYIAQPGWEVFFNIEEFRTGRLLSDLLLFELKKLQYKV